MAAGKAERNAGGSKVLRAGKILNDAGYYILHSDNVFFLFLFFAGYDTCAEAA